MALSIFLAKLMGLYLVILSLALLINKQSLMTFINGIAQNTAIQMVIGLVMLVIGLMLILTHNIWQGTIWQIVVTVLAWIIAIKGFIYIAFPSLIQSMAKTYRKSTGILYFSLLINLLVGLYLCYYGFSLQF